MSGQPPPRPPVRRYGGPPLNPRGQPVGGPVPQQPVPVVNPPAQHPLQDLNYVRNRINQYLRSGFFKKKGNLLLRPGEKFKQVTLIKPLALGLNNAVYSIRVDYKYRGKGISKRDYILRAFPNNNDVYKARNEAARMMQIQHLQIPKPALYIYEDKLNVLGYRFMIMEKISGKSVLETVEHLNRQQILSFLADLAKFLGILHMVRSNKWDSYYLEKKRLKGMSFGDYILSEVNNILQGFANMKLDFRHQVDTRYLYKWFQGHKPLLQLNGYSLIHGDVRPSNIIVEENKITGVIDWEMCCFGDPAQDLGWTLFFFNLYEHLKRERGFFFDEYWKYCSRFDFEARVYFYEFLAAIKMYTYVKMTERVNPQKAADNREFFNRVKNGFPKYIKRVTHRD
ncbi:MAG: phosphotransferase family protein [Promethearchaeota archaeon]